jgi:hypothetical protein
VAGIRSDRTSLSFYEWLNSGSYFPKKSKSVLGRSVGPLSLSFGKAGGRQISHFLVKLPIKPLVIIARMGYKNGDYLQVTTGWLQTSFKLKLQYFLSRIIEH